MSRVHKQMYSVFMLVLVVSTMLLVPARADSLESPSDMLKRTSDDVIKVLKEKRAMLDKEPDLVYQIVDQYILPHLDDVTMAKLALGKNWRSATNEQKIAFVDEFRDLLIRTYSKSLQEFRDQTINFFPVDVASGEDKAIVKSEIVQNGGPTIPVAYRVRIKDNSWKVYDITIDGVSLVTSYRGTFTQEVRKSGMDGLLLLLRDKNAVIPVDKNTKETES
jgi:phospholipid transport system substrate-binding protein